MVEVIYFYNVLVIWGGQKGMGIWGLIWGLGRLLYHHERLWFGGWYFYVWYHHQRDWFHWVSGCWLLILDFIRYLFLPNWWVLYTCQVWFGWGYDGGDYGCMGFWVLIRGLGRSLSLHDLFWVGEWNFRVWCLHERVWLLWVSSPWSLGLYLSRYKFLYSWWVFHPFLNWLLWDSDGGDWGFAAGDSSWVFFIFLYWYWGNFFQLSHLFLSGY